jgi:transcriptional regulator with XRE-family HTH domain
MAADGRTLGAILAALRTRNGWTLKEMSTRTGFPISTLSKVEHDRLSLSYEKLQQLGERLNIRMSDLFAEAEERDAPRILGRRSIGTIDNAIEVQTANYDYHFLCAELRNKRMVPVITRPEAGSIEEFGELVRHSGEEFIYVVKGTLVVHTEFYDPIELQPGQSIYIDSGMGHAYVRGPGCKEVLAIGIMSSADEDLSMLANAEHHPGATKTRRRRSAAKTG